MSAHRRANSLFGHGRTTKHRAADRLQHALDRRANRVIGWSVTVHKWASRDRDLEAAWIDATILPGAPTKMGGTRRRKLVVELLSRYVVPTHSRFDRFAPVLGERIRKLGERSDPGITI